MGSPTDQLERVTTQELTAVAPAKQTRTPNSSQTSGTPTANRPEEWQAHIESRLDRIEGLLLSLVQQRTVKDWYSTEEVAHLLQKAEFTVREWCRLGRVLASKKGSGRGKFQAWVIAHEELQRIQKEGLLPLRRG